LPQKEFPNWPKKSMIVRPDWKNNSNQTYSCPRGWRHGGPIEGSPETPWTITALPYCGVSGGLSPPIFRQMPVSRTANVSFSSLEARETETCQKESDLKIAPTDTLFSSLLLNIQCFYYFLHSYYWILLLFSSLSFPITYENYFQCSTKSLRNI